MSILCNTRAQVCISRVLLAEGGFVNDPDDPGGPTNKGITLSTFRRYIKRDGTIADLRNLTDDQAMLVYKRRYWDKVMADSLPVGVDYSVSDFAVNSGVSRGARALQAAVGVRRDGLIGPKTLEAVRAADPQLVISAIAQRRLRFLRRLNTWWKYGDGWSARVSKVRALSLQDAKT